MELALVFVVIWIIWRLSKYFESRATAKHEEWRFSPSRSASSFTSKVSSEPFDFEIKQKAASERRRVWIKYQDEQGRITKRKIEIYSGDSSYLFAWCCLRNEPRTFKIDNILEWQLLGERYEWNPAVDRYIREQLLPKNWASKVSWDEWQKASRSQPSSSPIRVEVSPAEESTYWITPGKTLWLHGFKIPGGGLYYGTGLRALNEYRGTEPALIDPKLSIDKFNVDKAGKNVPYWPSYSELVPASRAGYLEWLATAREDGDVHVGYPFLFFYGLERRLLGSGNPFAHDKSELEFMQKELLRLLSLYGKIGSFKNYGNALLEIVEVSRDKEGVYRTSPPTDRHGDSLPARVQVVISQFGSSDQPLPADWALSWVLCHPEARLRMPARRCREELRELFHVRYQKEFGDGLKLRPGKGQLTLRYRPASPTFGRELMIPTSLPQVPALRSVPTKLVELVEHCTDELEAYSRYVGNKKAEEGDLASIALLPLELAKQHQGRASLELRAWIEQVLHRGEPAVIGAQELLTRWRAENQSRLSKAESVLLAQLLEKWKYGMEPDVRFSGPSLRKEGKVVLFRLDDVAATTPSPEYAAATVLLHLGTMVAMADGDLSGDEESHLREHLQLALRMGESERRRLTAHLAWIRTEQPSISGLRKRLETLDKAQKVGLAQFLITLAGADGHLSSEELDTLAKIYSLFGFAREQLYADIHGLSIPETALQDGLVTVRQAEPAQTQYRIPRRVDPKAKQGFSLDMAKVNAKLAETASVCAILSHIFIADDVTMPPAMDAKGIGTLDARHSQFLKALLSKERWERSAIDELASTMKLLPDGALEVINEASFELVGEALWEGDDPIQINLSIAKEMIACQR